MNEFSKEQLDAAEKASRDEAEQLARMYASGAIRRCANGEYFAAGKTTTNERQAVRWAFEE